jgi:hypothetical protein
MPIKSYPKAAQKARRAMMATYGKKKGLQVFYATANKRGRGKTRMARVRSAFRKRRR